MGFASYQREQEEGGEVGVHDRSVLLVRVVQAGFANADPDVVHQDVQQTAKVIFRLLIAESTYTYENVRRRSTPVVHRNY